MVLLLAISLFVSGCSSSSGSESDTVVPQGDVLRPNIDGVESYVKKTIMGMGDDTNLEHTYGIMESDHYVIPLSADAMVVVTEDAVMGGGKYSTPQIEVEQAMELAIGAVSPGLSAVERKRIMKELPLFEQTATLYTDNDGTEYYYMGNDGGYFIGVKSHAK